MELRFMKTGSRDTRTTAKGRKVIDKRVLLSSLMLALSCSAFFSMADAQTIYWTDVETHKIQRATLEHGSGVEDLVTVGVITPTDIALDPTRGKMYWTESSPADFMILRANTDGTNVEFLVEGLSNPSGIAVDPDGAKIYWTDLGSGKIQRASLDGTGVEDLVTAGVQEPVDIALDLSHGKMYWTEASPGDYAVFRADLDGANKEGIVAGLGTRLSGIAVDPSGEKIYWTDRSVGKIKRANLDGSEEEDLITAGTLEPVRIALDLSRGMMYWTEGSLADFMISRANLDGSGGEFLVTGLTSPSGIAIDVESSPVPVHPITWGQIKARYGN